MSEVIKTKIIPSSTIWNLAIYDEREIWIEAGSINYLHTFYGNRVGMEQSRYYTLVA